MVVENRSIPLLIQNLKSKILRFHSPKLAEWLDIRGVSFALRQKKDFHFQAALDEEYQVVKNLGFKPNTRE